MRFALGKGGRYAVPRSHSPRQFVKTPAAPLRVRQVRFCSICHSVPEKISSPREDSGLCERLLECTDAAPTHPLMVCNNASRSWDHSVPRARGRFPGIPGGYHGALMKMIIRHTCGFGGGYDTACVIVNPMALGGMCLNIRGRN